MLWHTAITHVCLLAAGASGAAIQQQPLQAGTRDPLDRLRERVGARLIDVAPVAKPCYGKGAWNSSDCLEVRGKKGEDYWTSHQPGGYYYSNWASCQFNDQACAISSDPNPPPIPEGAICHNGTVPPRMIRIDHVNTLDDDIDAAFEYIRATDVPLVIKNTGHDWKGRATAPNSLALWTHNLQAPNTSIEFDEAFTPFKCKNHPKEKVFHYGPGQTWGDAYKAAEARGLSVLGGTCPTVGIAGWFQGGGHSPVTPLYGMGVDNLRQLEIVTPKEGKLIVNECTDPDLWFAIRGGGAGSFGIVTKITYKALEREPVVNLRYTINPKEIKGWSRKDMVEYLDILASNAVEWSQKGWGGYIKSTELGVQVVELAKANSTGQEVAADMEKLFEFLDKHNVPYPVLNHHSWPEYVKIVETNHPAGGSMNVATRLVPEASLVGDKKKQLVDALMNVYDNHLNFWLMLVAPTTYKGPVFKSAIHPTWRTATMLVRVMDKWDLFHDTVTSTVAKSHYETLKKNFDPIRALLPNMGTSVSESDIWEEDHISSFWGKDNHRDLLPIKKRVDPENLLTNWHAINWKAEHPRYQCYPKM